jgi:hypothetical protein
MFSLQPPRHIPTLPSSTDQPGSNHVRMPPDRVRLAAPRIDVVGHRPTSRINSSWVRSDVRKVEPVEAALPPSTASLAGKLSYNRHTRLFFTLRPAPSRRFSQDGQFGRRSHIVLDLHTKSA